MKNKKEKQLLSYSFQYSKDNNINNPRHFYRHLKKLYNTEVEFKNEFNNKMLIKKEIGWH